MLKIGIAIVAVVALLAVVGAVWWSLVGSRKPMGFLDYVRNPKAWKAQEDSIEAYQAAIVEESKKPAEVLVEGLLENGDPLGTPSRAIKAAGPRVVPALLAAVNDPRFRVTLQESEWGFPRMPLDGVFDCLGEFAPPEAVRVVSPLATDEDEDVRKIVALLLATIATDEAAPMVVELLKDKNDRVRRYAVMGIGRALRAGRVNEQFRKTMFDALTPVALADGDKAPACLLRLDRERAIPILTSQEALSADQPHLHHILKGLREAKVEVDEGQLIALLAALESSTIERKKERSVEQILLMLATFRSEQALATIENYMDHPSQRIREGAAEARLVAQGLDDPLGPVWDKLESEGWSGLTEPQRHVLAVRRLIDEVNNGGFLQYFFNNSGDHWRDAAAGLEAIGATGDRQLLDQVLAFFKENSPSENRDSRHHQIAAIAKQDDRPFDKIEKQFYKDTDSREVLLNEYILKSAGDFGTNVR